MDVIFQIILVSVMVGGALYLLGMAPINETVKKMATVLVLLAGILWALRILRGLF